MFCLAGRNVAFVVRRLLLTISVERVVDDELVGKDFVVIFEIEMAKPFCNGFESRRLCAPVKVLFPASVALRQSERCFGQKASLSLWRGISRPRRS